MTTVIQFENLSKLYRLGTVGTGTLSHDLNRWWHRIRGKEDPYSVVGQINDRTAGRNSAEADRDYVWALKDICLDVQQGEILGIIGRNGAGKSTLLKILSKITAPTRGVIRTRGRIASLLEVGTGFHPELTGRENIYLNGAILGMKRREITEQLDDIADFSGCSRYLDTPVKRYSSGMLVRLGFAVAAHLRCEILIVDEVLAVGDFEFQKACISRMEDIGQEGRTILLVSHNLSTITSLASRCCLLVQGEIAACGSPADVVARYTQLLSEQKAEFRGAIRSAAVRAVDGAGHPQMVPLGGAVRFTVEYETPEEPSAPVIGIGINTLSGERVLSVNSNQNPERLRLGRRGQVHCTIDQLPLPPGRYSATVILNEHGARDIDVVEHAATFEVIDAPFGHDRTGFHAGVCVAHSRWQTDEETIA